MVMTESRTITTLRNELSSLNPSQRMEHREVGISHHNYIQIISNIATPNFDIQLDDLNVKSWKTFTKNHSMVGWDALNKDKVAICLFANEDSLLRIPKLNMSTLVLHLLMSTCSALGKVFNPPIIIVADSKQVAVKVKELLKHLVMNKRKFIHVIECFTSYSLNPMMDLARDKDNNYNPQLSSTGSADLPFILSKHNLIQFLISEHYEYLYCIDSRNSLGLFDETILGYHISSNKDITHEIVAREPGDRNLKFPVWLNGRIVFLRERELIQQNIKTEIEQCPYIPNGNKIINVENLAKVINQINPTYVREKNIINNKIVIEFKSSPCQLELNSESSLLETPRKTRYLLVNKHSLNDMSIKFNATKLI